MAKKTVVGKLGECYRMQSSINGNPRWSVTLNGVEYRTRVDDSLGYEVGNFRDKIVAAEVGVYYGRNTVFTMRLFKSTHLKNVNLEGVVLRCVDLQNIDLQGINLRGSDLSYTNLEGANLEGANLEGANLEGATK